MRTTVWYVLCSIAVLYDHAETSYLFYSTGRVCRCHALNIFRSQLDECSLEPPALMWYFFGMPTTPAHAVSSPRRPWVLFYIAILYESADTNFLFSIIGLVGFLPPKKFRTTAWRCHRYTAGQILEDLLCAIQ